MSHSFPFTWQRVGGGQLALWHRPRLRAIPYLPRSGCDRVVTLLSEREGAEEIGDAVREAGLAWTWIPLDSGRPPEGRVEREFVARLDSVAERLAQGESVLLHCSAGIHRTGMAALVLLFRSGVDEAEALRTLEALRSHTRRGLDARHVEWARRATAPRDDEPPNTAD